MKEEKKWMNNEVTASLFMKYLEVHNYDNLIFGSWARKLIVPETECQDLDVLCFNFSVEYLIKNCDEFDIVLISHGQSSPELCLSKLVINSNLKVDFVYPAYKERYTLSDFENYLFNSPLERESFYIYKNEYFYDQRKFGSLSEAFSSFSRLKVNPYFNKSLFATTSTISNRLLGKGMKPLTVESYPHLAREIQKLADEDAERKARIRKSKMSLPFAVQQS